MNATSVHAGSSTHILIVEDSPTQAAHLKNMLQQDGYTVSQTRDGKEALRWLQTHETTMVITDINMPEMNGYELCHSIRDDTRLRDLPVILLTSLSDPEDIVRGLECGADNFITKPFEIGYLLSRIRHILATQHLHRYEKAGISLEVFFAGRKHVITADRLQILNLLLSTYETAVLKNQQLEKAQEELSKVNEKLEQRVRERTTALSAEIDERRRAEEKVREQAALLDITPDAVSVRGLDDRIEFWNHGAERIYGWSKNEALGKKANELVFPEVNGEFEKAKASVLDHKEWRGELKQVTKEGTEILVESHWTLMTDTKGRPKSVLVVNTDITERRKLESQLLRNQRMESIGLLAGGIAHDLNNVLAPILMATELLKFQLPDPEDQRVLDTVQLSAQRGADLVKQILSFSRGVEERTLVQCRHLIKELRSFANETFPKSIELRTEAPNDLWTINADSTELHQVLMNLCVNARDAMPNGGLLSIWAKNVVLDENFVRMHYGMKAGSYLLVGVKDTGTGISPEIVPRIFEPFFTTKPPGKGTGLGLATVAAILKKYGGTLTVDSEMGKGTEFKLYLPAQVGGEAEAAASERVSLPVGHGETVLIVDDEAAIREIAQEILKTYGYDVITVGNGVEAIAFCAQNMGRVKVVLSDMNMPVMDGASLIRTLNRIDSSIKIIRASGQAEDSGTLAQSELVVNASLPKPYTAEKLVTTVGLVLQQSVIKRPA